MTIKNVEIKTENKNILEINNKLLQYFIFKADICHA
jgi:hypothetical protein